MSRVPGTTCGWETGDINEIGTAVSNGTVTGAVVSSTPTPPSHNYCFKASITIANTNQHYYRSVAMGSNLTDLWVRDRIVMNLGTSETASNNLKILRFLDSGGTEVGHIVVDTTGTLRYYSGGSVNALGTLRGSSSSPITFNTPNLIDVHLVPATGATGTVEIWINNVQVLNATSVITSGGLANVATIAVGLGRLNNTGGTTVFCAHDDFGVNDTAGSINNGRLGDNKVTWLPASGAGASAQWTPLSGANYTNVDDTGDLSGGTADYVSTNTTAQVDDYACANLPSGAATVAVVVPMVYAINPDAGATQIKVGVISGGTTSAGSAQSPGASYSYLRNRLETDPDTSAAWTVSAVNAAKVRIESA